MKIAHELHEEKRHRFNRRGLIHQTPYANCPGIGLETNKVPVARPRMSRKGELAEKEVTLPNRGKKRTIRGQQGARCGADTGFLNSSKPPGPPGFLRRYNKRGILVFGFALFLCIANLGKYFHRPAHRGIKTNCR